jgi:uncharacterized protein Veg
MQVKTVENKLKSLAKIENRRRAKRRKEFKISDDTKGSNYSKLDWRDVLGMRWQVKNLQFKGHRGKCDFDPLKMQAYSYNHWQFVRMIKGKVVFNSYRYSMTTGTHQGTVASIMRRLGIKIDLEIETGNSLSNFENAALPSLYEELFVLEIAHASKNAKDRSWDISDLKKRIAKAKSLGAVITSEKMELIKQECQKNEADRLQKARKTRVKNNEQARAARELEKLNKLFDTSMVEL